MQLPFGGHSKSCKNEKKSLVFSVNDLLSHFLFYLSLSLLIKIFLVFWFKNKTLLSLVQFSHSVIPDSLRPHESQHARPPCPSPTPVYPNSCPLSWWCHPAISSSVFPFSSCPQFLPASGSFPVNQLFTWGGQGIAVSASASVFPMNTQDWFPLGWTDWISLQSKGLFKSLLQHCSSKASILQRSANTATCRQL